MNFETYIPLAIRTCKELPLAAHVNHMHLGVIGEMGEIIDQLKKAYIYGKPLDQVNIVEEVGDTAWYVAGIVNLFPNLHGVMETYTPENMMDLERLGVARSRLTYEIVKISGAISEMLLELQEEVDEDNMAAAEDSARVLTMGFYGLCQLLEVDMAQALEINIAKLAKRYGDKYSDYAAINRDLDGERAVLEGKTA